MATVGSVVARRQLGRELRALREASGRTREDVSNLSTGIASLAKLARIEHGLTSIRPGDVRELCLLYGVPEETTERLVEMARGTRHEEWWESQDTKAPRWFGMYLALEEVASRLQAFEPTLIHGLFQTPEYSRQIEISTAPTPGREAEAHIADAHTALRMRRQERVFTRETPLRIELVLGEAPVRAVPGSQAVLDAQLAHLRTLAARPEIDVRVVPQGRSNHPGAYGQFTIMDFPQEKDPSVVYVETYEAARYPEKPDQVARFRNRFEALRAVAVPLEEFEL
jgi:transcriptional regulator with XRE-family HTH domain